MESWTPYSVFALSTALGGEGGHVDLAVASNYFPSTNDFKLKSESEIYI